MMQSLRFSSRGIVAVSFVLMIVACSSKTIVVRRGPPPCDPTQCAPKNECIPDATGVAACRIGCETHTDCPFNTQCLTSAPRSYCVKQTTQVDQKPTGQWGYPCLPSGGLEGNPACSAETGFACYGAGTTDALAYCTQYDCAEDLDCAGGFYCATINVAPNVRNDRRTFGKTRSVCLKRSYCSPCAGDIDCPVVDGQQSLCTTDDVGDSYCTTRCTSTANCRLDAACNGVAPDGSKVCRPRAGVCKGDGSLCSPCRSDVDCPKGFCIKAGYSPETFCSVKAASDCPAPTMGGSITKGECPAFPAKKATQIGCEAVDGNNEIPRNQCVGLIEFGDTGDIACYTIHP
jgi:hypothetical protein